MFEKNGWVKSGEYEGNIEESTESRRGRRELMFENAFGSPSGILSSPIQHARLMIPWHASSTFFAEVHLTLVNKQSDLTLEAKKSERFESRVRKKLLYFDG